MRRVFVLLLMLTIAGCNHRSVAFKQVYSGPNGPTGNGMEYLSTRVELDNSWVKQSLEPAEFERLFSKVDFSKQAIAAFSSGKTTAFSRMEFVDVYQYTGTSAPSMSALVKLGMFKDECKVKTLSLPFALAIIERPVGFVPGLSVDMSTVRDECPPRR